MESVLRRSEAVPLPRPPRELVRSAAAVRWRRIVKRFYEFAEQPPQLSQRELPPEWFRYPLP